MTISNQPRRRVQAVQGSLGLFATVLCAAISGSAHAFGGVWSSRSAPVAQSAIRVAFVDDPGPTITAIVQLAYDGPAQDFAWVIPVPSTPTVKLSSSTVFDRLDTATAPEYWVAQTVDSACGDAGLDAGPGYEPIEPPDEMPAISERSSVGPYDFITAQLDATHGDPLGDAIAWLTANGYELTSLDRELLEPYVQDGWKLVAFKLKKGADVSELRPIALTYEAAQPAIPIRAAAVAAHDAVGVDVWVFGPSQAVPDNYKSLVLNDALIDWLSARAFLLGTLPQGGAGPFGSYVPTPSNYQSVVSAAANEAGGRGFVTELGGPASQYRELVWSALDEETFATIKNDSYADGLDAILAAQVYYGAWDGWKDAIAGATTLPDDVTLDELVSDPERYRGAVTVDTDAFLQLLDHDVIKPISETAAMFYRAPYLTRLHSTMDAEAMKLDPSFDYNPELAQISNVRIATQRFDCDGSWRMELPQGGVVAGNEGDDWPIAAGSLPASLKVVMLGTHGSGTVLEDNSEEIRSKLVDTILSLQPPLNGLLIGGSQTVTELELTDAGPSSPPESSDNSCSVAHVGTSDSSASALCLLFAALLLAVRKRSLVFASVLLAALAGGCGDDAAPTDAGSNAVADAGDAPAPGALSREQLRDPESCKGCHPVHYREWSGSMHAYAAQDPVFIAMNKRGQRETHGELGDFCVKCHAPMAVLDGLTKDGLNLDQLPDKDRGVSCYFCHNAVDVEGDHNAMLKLADDTTMRGPIRDPFEPGAHRAKYSELFEDSSPKSSALCGGCHDIVTPNGVHLERTLEEYRFGIFSKSALGDPRAFDSCVGCHMTPEQGFAAAVPGVPMRSVHEHLWPGVDVALTDFPHREAMRSAVEDCQLGGASISFFTLEVTPPDLFTFQIETGAGHNQPSGAAQDRRMWIEFLAYDENGELLEQSSGNIADDEIEEKPEGDPEHDPHLVMFRDRIYDAQGEPVHMFWQAAKSEAYPNGYESNTLPVSTTTYISGKHAVLKQFRASGPNGLPARVTARLRMRPIGMDVLQDLVESGDLDPAVVAEMPTFTFGAQIEWTPESGLMTTISAVSKTDCSTYRCLLDPGSNGCD